MVRDLSNRFAYNPREDSTIMNTILVPSAKQMMDAARRHERAVALAVKPKKDWRPIGAEIEVPQR